MVIPPLPEAVVNIWLGKKHNLADRLVEVWRPDSKMAFSVQCDQHLLRPVDDGGWPADQGAHDGGLCLRPLSPPPAGAPLGLPLHLAPGGGGRGLRLLLVPPRQSRGGLTVGGAPGHRSLLVATMSILRSRSIIPVRSSTWPQHSGSPCFKVGKCQQARAQYVWSHSSSHC